MNISKNLATNILQQLKNIINQDLNYINEDGTIIASTDPKRVGTFHAASVECIKREKTIIIENDNEYIGSKKGINMPIYFDESIIGVIGITGDKKEVSKFGEIIRLMTSILLKEAWIKDQDIRKGKIVKSFIERIVLEYEHDFFPMTDFLFPYVVIVGKADKNDVFIDEEDIQSVLKDNLAYNRHNYFTFYRNEVIILYHYYKHGKKEVKVVADWIKQIFYNKVDSAVTIKELLAVEGELWMNFYSMFQFFLPEDFIMNKRVKRPPDNPINALISFGNTLLYTKTISAIYRTHLDQRISFLHEPSEGRFSLSLDISEVFKPIIVYKTIFEFNITV